MSTYGYTIWVPNYITYPSLGSKSAKLLIPIKFINSFLLVSLCNNTIISYPSFSIKYVIEDVDLRGYVFSSIVYPATLFKNIILEIK